MRSWGAELCLTILGSSAVKSPLIARMWVAALRHARVVKELTVLQAAMSSFAELVLGRLPDKASQMEVMNELTAKFQKLEELCSRLEGPGTRIYSLLLGSPLDQAC
jgi:hypothetical protein